MRRHFNTLLFTVYDLRHECVRREVSFNTLLFTLYALRHECVRCEKFLTFYSLRFTVCLVYLVHLVHRGEKGFTTHA